MPPPSPRKTRGNVLIQKDDSSKTKSSNTTDPTIADLYKMMQDLHLSMEFLSKKYDDFLEKLKKTEEENITLKKTNTLLNNRLTALETDYYTQQQRKYNNFITIHGIPKEHNENINEIIVSTIKIIDTRITADNIISARRMNVNNVQNIAPIIIAEITNEMKESVKIKYKQNGPIMLSQILNNKPNTDHKKVFINDYLCNYMKQLYDQTKQLKAKLNIKFVWTKNGTILARKNEDSPVMKIKNHQDLLELENNCK